MNNVRHVIHRLLSEFEYLDILNKKGLATIIDEETYMAAINSADSVRSVQATSVYVNRTITKNGSNIEITSSTYYSWDVILHEYGHYIQDIFNIEDSPGGLHGLGDNMIDYYVTQKGYSVYKAKDEGCRLAWSEGWATYFGIIAQISNGVAAMGIPGAGDSSYNNMHNGLEANIGSILGRQNITASTLKTNNLAPINYYFSSDVAPTFRWTDASGSTKCPDTYMILIYDTSMNLLYTISVSGSTSHTLSDIRWEIIKTNYSDGFYWCVRTTQTTTPATGPYYSQFIRCYLTNIL